MTKAQDPEGRQTWPDLLPRSANKFLMGFCGDGDDFQKLNFPRALDNMKGGRNFHSTSNSHKQTLFLVRFAISLFESHKRKLWVQQAANFTALAKHALHRHPNMAVKCWKRAQTFPTQKPPSINGFEPRLDSLPAVRGRRALGISSLW